MSEETEVGKLITEVGKDLFGGGASSHEESPETTTTPPSGEASPPPIQAEEVDIPLPKAWKKEKEPLWKKLDREAREYIQTRETDVLKGFEQYSNSHKNWQELTSPFQPVLQQYPDVNPVQLMQNLMRNHLAIVQASPEQKRTLAQNLLKSYGIDLSPAQAQAVVNQAQGGQPQNQLPPEVHHLSQELHSVKQTLQQFQQQQYARAVEEQAAQVESFAKDPKNKYFDEVGDDIVRFIKTGAATDLASAYELACYANPAVRAKIIADQQSTLIPPVPTVKPTNLNGSAEGTPSSRKKASIESTINDVVAKHYSSH